MTDELWDRQNKALGAFIRAQRELASLSLRQLSDMTDVSNAYLSQIERGLHEPSIRVLRSVARALGMPAEVLLSQAGLIENGGVDGAGVPAAGGVDGAGVPAAGGDTAAGGGVTVTSLSVEDAVRADPHLTDAEKDALLAVYRSYRAGR